MRSINPSHVYMSKLLTIVSGGYKVEVLKIRDGRELALMGNLLHTLCGSGNTGRRAQGMEELEDGVACGKKASSGHDATTALISAIAQDLHKTGHNIHHGRG